MPIYEYECEGCGSVFEELMRFSDPDPVCATCGRDQVRKLISNTSFQLKGSGWYVTDYADKGGSRAKKEANSSDGSGGGDSTSAESDSKKAAEKTATKTTKKKTSAGSTAATA